jgi:anti-sigma B factor antagonist
MSGDARPQFALTECAIDDLRHVVAVRGELDMYTGPALKKALVAAAEAGRARLIVDLTEATYMDESVPGVLIVVFKRVRLRGGALVIVNVDKGIATLLELTGLDQVFTIVATRAEAAQAVAATATR